MSIEASRPNPIDTSLASTERSRSPFIDSPATKESRELALFTARIPYSSGGFFRDEVSEKWKEIRAECPPILQEKKSSLREEEARRGYALYRHAYLGRLPFIILGGPEIRSDLELIQNCGTISTIPQIRDENLEILRLFMKKVLLPKNAFPSPSVNPELFLKDHLRKGSILCESNWWPFQNDAFMFGAVHAHKDFHMGFLPRKDLVWDEENGRPTVLGRELFLLALCGYRRIQHKAFEKSSTFILPKNAYKQAKSMTIKKFREALSKATSYKEFFVFTSQIMEFAPPSERSEC